MLESNTSEVESGYNPADPSSHPVRIISITKGANQVTLTWQSAAGASYTVESCTNFPAAASATTNWNPLAAALIAPGPLTIFTDSPPVIDFQRFYRVRLE